MKLSEKQMDLIRHYFVDKPMLKAYVFGSYARGKADADSDIDLLVELDYVKHIGMTFIGMKLELEYLLVYKVDLVTDRSLSKQLTPLVEKDKNLIYEKTAGR
jgi:predicted nucleotidyltransferase